jgi:hypothetical protein
VAGGPEEGSRQPAVAIHAFGKGTVYRDSVAVTQSDWGAA